MLRILESHKREPEFGLLGEDREYVDMNVISVFGDVGDIMRSSQRGSKDKYNKI